MRKRDKMDHEWSDFWVRGEDNIIRERMVVKNNPTVDEKTTYHKVHRM